MSPWAGYFFVGGWLSCRAHAYALRSWKAGKTFKQIVSPSRSDPSSKKVPKVSEVG